MKGLDLNGRWFRSRSVNGSSVPAGCNPVGCTDCSQAGFAAEAALEVNILEKRG